MVSILILINELLGGGTERVISELANDLPSEINRKLVVINDTERKYSLVQEPISLHYSYSKHIPERIYALFKLIPVTLKYCRLLNKNKPDASVSMLDFDNLVNLIACHITGTKAITGVRQSLITNENPLLARKLRVLTTYLGKKYAVKIITNSYGQMNELINYYNVDPEKIAVIYNPKDIELIQALKLEPVEDVFFQTSDPIIITVGRLYDTKGQWHLLRIFAKLRADYPCKLVICGEGPLREKLEILAMELGIRDDVLFVGWCDNPYKYISKSTVFAFPSLSEGLPNALIEAMICGCPVVSADCECGPREIILDNKYGLLSHTLDSKWYGASDPLNSAEMDMLLKIRLLVDNPDLREFYAQNGFKRGELFDKYRIMQEYALTISNACKRE